MQIDWVTVTAQIVNFLVLVYLLQRFLYRPVMNAMARRAQRITDQLEEARRRENEAGREAQRYREQQQALEEQRQAFIAEAREQAEAERRARLEEAREERDTLRRQWQKQIEREKADFLQGLKAQVVEAASAIAQRVLGDLADTQLERQVVGVFLSRLAAMDQDDRRRLGEVAGPAEIVTAFEIADTQRRRISRALKDSFGFQGEIRYRRSPELLWGVELRMEGRKLAWTAADYLQALEDRMKTALGALGGATQGEETGEKGHAGAGGG